MKKTKIRKVFLASQWKSHQTRRLEISLDAVKTYVPTFSRLYFFWSSSRVQLNFYYLLLRKWNKKNYLYVTEEKKKEEADGVWILYLDKRYSSIY